MEEYVASEAFSLISVAKHRVLWSILNSHSPGQSSIEMLVPVATDAKSALGSLLATELDLESILGFILLSSKLLSSYYLSTYLSQYISVYKKRYEIS